MARETKSRYFVISDSEPAVTTKANAQKELLEECRRNPGDRFYLCEVLFEAEVGKTPLPVIVKKY